MEASERSADLMRPVFIVGCPRSGTGLLHQLLRLHPEVAWITPVTNWICGKSWFRKAPPNVIRAGEQLLNGSPRWIIPPFLRGPYDGSLGAEGIFETHEGHSIWNRVLPSVADHEATEQALTPEIRRDLHEVVRWHSRYHDASRFLSKTPRNIFRLRFLRAIFPGAFVVHLVRDGRAVAASILKRRLHDHRNLDEWWGVRPPGWKTLRHRPPLEQAAWTWKKCVERAREDAALFSKGHFLKVHYEALTERPGEVLEQLLLGIDLDPEAFFESNARKQLEKIHAPSKKWPGIFRSQEGEALAMLRPELRRQGYLDDLGPSTEAGDTRTFEGVRVVH